METTSLRLIVFSYLQNCGKSLPERPAMGSIGGSANVGYAGQWDSQTLPPEAPRIVSLLDLPRERTVDLDDLRRG